MFMAIMVAAFSMVACSSDSREDEIPDTSQDKKRLWRITREYGKTGTMICFLV